MHTIYKIHNNSNIFYALLSVVFRWYTQRKCTHKWDEMLIGRIEHNYGGANKYRCPKCKKVKYEFY